MSAVYVATNSPGQPLTPSKQWNSMRVKMYSNDPDIQLEAAQFFRKQLSQNLSASTYGMTDLIPRLVELLDDSEHTQLQFELGNYSSNSLLAKRYSRIGLISFDK
uniref:Uncharacterized protein n=1 Tax=Romanomermis culicivorax TaxID=13658 RepID=A0A915KN93_ROMCU